MATSPTPNKGKPKFTAEWFLETKMNGKLRDNPESMDGFDCVYQFEIDDRVWHLDLTGYDNRQIVRGPHNDSDCTIKMSEENFEKMLKRQLNVPLALVTGKIKIKGDKALVLKLMKLFS